MKKEVLLIIGTLIAWNADAQVIERSRFEPPPDWDYEGMGDAVDIKGDFAVAVGRIGKAICYEKCGDGWAPIGEIDRGFGGQATVSIGDDYIAVLCNGFTSAKGVWVYDRATLSYVTFLNPYSPGGTFSDHGVRFIGNLLFVSFDSPSAELWVYDGDNSWSDTVVDNTQSGYLTGFEDRLFLLNVNGMTEYQDISGWTAVSSIVNSDPSMIFFGRAMAAAQDVVALWSGNGTANNVDIYEWDGLSWTMMNQISCATMGEYSYDGIAINSDILLFRDDNGSYVYDSRIRVVRKTGADWSSVTEEDELVPQVVTGFDFLGNDIAIDGNDVIAGAMFSGPAITGHPSNFTGIVYFYEDIPLTPMQLLLYADGTSAHATTWEVVDESDNVWASGGPYTGGCALHTENFDLPAGKYGLRVYDDDNTVCSGGFVLQTTAGDRVLDASQVITFTGGVSHVTDFSVNANRAFDIPVSHTVLTSHCDGSTARNTWLEVSEQCEVAYNCQNGIDDGTTGYQFLWFQPHGPSVRAVTFYNGSPEPGTPGTGCDAVRFVNPSGFVTNPVPIGTYLNFKVRAVIGGINKPWGPVCRLYYSSMRPGRFVVSPNPIPAGTSQLTVTERLEPGIVDVDDPSHVLVGWTIFDPAGRVIETRSGSNIPVSAAPFQLDLHRSLSPGTYLVHLNTTMGREAMRVFVQ